MARFNVNARSSGRPRATWASSSFSASSLTSALTPIGGNQYQRIIAGERCGGVALVRAGVTQGGTFLSDPPSLPGHALCIRSFPKLSPASRGAFSFAGHATLYAVKNCSVFGDGALWHFSTDDDVRCHGSNRGECVAKLGYFCGLAGLSVGQLVAFSAVPFDGRQIRLAGLRGTGDYRRWRRAAEELDEAPQVLSGCG
jgi:hypothetical protein